MTPDRESHNDLPTRNDLLRRLPVAQRQRLLALCRIQRFDVGTVLAEPAQLSTLLVFPLSGLVSESSGGGLWGLVQLHLIGSEGVIGASTLLARGMPTLCATVIAGGMALVIERRRWGLALQAAPRLHMLLQRYQSLQIGQLARAAVCLGFHEAQPRLARWLLTAADRGGGVQLAITHERLAVLLGLRRSGVTVCAGRLHARGFIDYRRGDIQILDRKGLEGAACICYGEDHAAHAFAFPN